VVDEEHDWSDFPWASAIRREMETWQPSPRRPLTVRQREARPARDWRLGAVILGAIALISNTAVITRSMDPRQWWTAAEQAVRQVVHPGPGGGAGDLNGRSRGVVVSDGSDHGPGLVAGAPASGRGGEGPAGNPATVGISIASGPGGGGGQGVAVTSDPRGRGGMTGSIGEGPAHASGTIDGAGMRGCIGAYNSTGGKNICGSLNLPVTVPVPPLPAPVVPNAAPSPN